LIQIEYRVVTKDGWLIWIHDDAVVARASDGGALHLQGYLADITARRESELELHEPQERYRALAEQLPFVTYIDDAVPEGPAQYISPQIEELLGYIPEEWLAGVGLFTSSVHPDDRVVVLERMRRYMIEGRTLEAEYRMVTRDGRVIYVRDTALPGSRRRRSHPPLAGLRPRHHRAARDRRAARPPARERAGAERAPAGSSTASRTNSSPPSRTSFVPRSRRSSATSSSPSTTSTRCPRTPELPGGHRAK
jgi:PAS domain S-box-containing protein